MKNINTLTDLKSFIKTAEAFKGEFIFKGFSIWWSNFDSRNGVQTPMDGYFRCDPCTDRQYNDYRKLDDRTFGGYEWVLS